MASGSGPFHRNSKANYDFVNRLGLPSSFVAEVNTRAEKIIGDAEDHPDGINLPLSQARELLTTAAGAAEAAATLTQLTSAGSEMTRRASLGSVARTAVENSLRVQWVLEGNTKEERIKRAVLVELKSINQSLRYLPAARLNNNDRDLRHAQEVYVKLVEDELGLDVDLHETPKIHGLQLPNIGREAQRVLRDESYIELSAFTHPNSYLASVTSSYSAGEKGQYIIVPESTLHTEGRLMQPALTAFVKATTSVAEYLGRDDNTELVTWISTCADLWDEWCERNGCPQ